MGASFSSERRYGRGKPCCCTLHVKPSCKGTITRKLPNRLQCSQLKNRAWRDIYQAVLSMFCNLFTFMESDGILDPDNEHHIFCLHAVYKPIINDMLTNFANAWINHKMRTTSNKSPLQIFIMGMHQSQHENDTIANQYFENLSEVS